MIFTNSQLRNIFWKHLITWKHLYKLRNIRKDECKDENWIDQNDRHSICGKHSLNGHDLSDIQCTNTVGSYICSCGMGWEWSHVTGSAAVCHDIDECTDYSHGCDHKAECKNTQG